MTYIKKLKKLKNLKINYWAIIATVVFGWLIGRFLRWDPARKRPFIEKVKGPRVTVETADNMFADAATSDA